MPRPTASSIVANTTVARPAHDPRVPGSRPSRRTCHNRVRTFRSSTLVAWSSPHCSERMPAPIRPPQWPHRTPHLRPARRWGTVATYSAVRSLAVRSAGRPYRWIVRCGLAPSPWACAPWSSRSWPAVGEPIIELVWCADCLAEYGFVNVVAGDRASILRAPRPQCLDDHWGFDN